MKKRKEGNGEVLQKNDPLRVDILDEFDKAKASLTSMIGEYTPFKKEKKER